MCAFSRENIKAKFVTQTWATANNSSRSYASTHEIGIHFSHKKNGKTREKNEKSKEIQSKEMQRKNTRERLLDQVSQWS